ncbi:response regulator transcription factor [Nocardioides zeae]|uniref:Response regulator transcription factor n=1 Tax=Nocardioides imazamoxiresistens TaxID=3231893 RepID=A0ABU3PTA1_9ACTN|nr:response regulator transcription factor [Nocardioides zeae]MDT9592465.1 response regulator transcription factor [Nocardioides zeae]
MAAGGGPGSDRTVLVVDDDEDLRFLIVTVLRDTGYRVLEATSGAQALETVRAESPDLVTLDLGLPDMDGTEVCRALREFSDAYVIMLTARTDESDRLAGLDVGADDYMDKPFSPKELRARVGAVLRRARPAAAAAPAAVDASDGAAAPVPSRSPRSPVVVDGGRGLTIFPDRDLALLHGDPLPLTGVEVTVLAALARTPGTPLSRRDLVRQVWTEDFGESYFLLDIHVGNLRRKLRKAGATGEWIRSVGGTAYELIGDDD